MRTLLFVLLLLTSCSTIRKKPLTFIEPIILSFNTPESEQSGILKSNDTIVYSGNDSFIICEDYIYFKPHLMHFYKNKIHEYYFIQTNKDLIDYVTLKYYKGELESISILTKDKARVDSVSNLIQKFYHKNFKDNGESGYYPKMKYSNFAKNNLLIYRTIFTENYEAEFILTNTKVKLPSWCGFRTPWWYYLTFWRW
ncbi:MAG: hypothetical protein CFE21_01080 [Bacteroidetes bacterium B1(2017)]|nr:MAG: hypothetical protein CFE21_01080 [Bacteroidetes bacterium B1(2017)]